MWTKSKFLSHINNLYQASSFLALWQVSSCFFCPFIFIFNWKTPFLRCNDQISSTILLQIFYIRLRNLWLPLFLNCWLAKNALDAVLVSISDSLNVFEFIWVDTHSKWSLLKVLVDKRRESSKYLKLISALALVLRMYMSVLVWISLAGIDPLTNQYWYF